MKWLRKTSEVFALTAGYILFGVMLLIVINVVLRYFFGAPILGAEEVVQLALVPATTLALALCGLTGGHVAVDLFDGMLGPVGRWIGDFLATGLGLVLISIFAWVSLEGAIESFEWGDTTNLLDIPLGPFFILMAFGALLYAIVLLIQFLLVMHRLLTALKLMVANKPMSCINLINNLDGTSQ